jgi:hypothetical protein
MMSITARRLAAGDAAVDAYRCLNRALIEP